MDAIEFQQRAQVDTDLNAFLIEVANALPTEDGDSSNQRYITVSPADATMLLAAYALFRFFKDTFDHYRARNETEIAVQRARLIQQLISEGFPQDKAQAVVNALLISVAKRTEDDPALTKARALLGSK